MHDDSFAMGLSLGASEAVKLLVIALLRN